MNTMFRYTAMSSMFLLAACSDPMVIDRDLTDCDQAGRVYSGNVAAGTWSRAISPHRLADTVRVNGTLVIEPGAVVCGMPGAILYADTLVAQGIPESPILFGSAAANDFWGGIRVRDAATLRHVRIVSARIPVTDGFGDYAAITLEDSHVQRAGSGMSAGRLVLRRVDVDSSCYGASAGCSAVYVQAYGSAALEDVRIRDSAGRGVATSYRCGLTLSNVAVERSAGTGLVLRQDVRGGCGVSVQMPVSVTGGGSYPVEADFMHVVANWLTPERAELLKGNARDTIVVSKPEHYSGPLTISRGLGVRLRACTGDYITYTRRFGRVTIEAGATLVIEGGCTWYMDLEMNGTPADPATIIALQTRIRSTLRADIARIQHAIVQGAVITADSSAMVFEDVQLKDASVHLLAVGSRIDGLIADGSAARLAEWPYETADPATVVLGAGTAMGRGVIANATADAVRVIGDAAIRDCTITGSDGHGVRVEAGLVSVQRCNLFSNAGPGVSNTGAPTVDATDNWWGDAAGPFGSAGDGVEGDVQFTPWRTVPVEFAGRGQTSPGISLLSSVRRKLSSR